MNPPCRCPCLLASPKPPHDAPLNIARLSRRESQVLEYLSLLMNTDEIAAAMYITPNTVRTHIRNLLRKLDAPNRGVAVRRAWQHHML